MVFNATFNNISYTFLTPCISSNILIFISVDGAFELVVHGVEIRINRAFDNNDDFNVIIME